MSPQIVLFQTVDFGHFWHNEIRTNMFSHCVTTHSLVDWTLFLLVTCRD